MRLFVGMPLDAGLISELSAVSLRLRSADDGLRWSPPESWHITLQFLGNTSEERYSCLVARLRELRLPPVCVLFDSLGFFDRVGVFFAQVRLTPELLSLQQQVTAATGACGLVPETRPYHPHITLARSKEKNRGLSRLKARIQRQPTLTSFIAQEFLLYESVASSSGFRYEARERFPLQ